MSNQKYRLPPALKHGAYSGMSVLPGEDPVAFEELRQRVFDELAPIGALEEDIVNTIASLIWRKQNMVTYERAKQTACPAGSIDMEDEVKKCFGLPAKDGTVGRALLTATDRDLLRMEGTIQHLMDELSRIAKIDGYIATALKRLLMLRGVKSISASPSLVPTQPKQIESAQQSGPAHSA